jgi:(2Fe-2S) ferredoxin
MSCTIAAGVGAQACPSRAAARPPAAQRQPGEQRGDQVRLHGEKLRARERDHRKLPAKLQGVRGDPAARPRAAAERWLALARRDAARREGARHGGHPRLRGRDVLLDVQPVQGRQVLHPGAPPSAPEFLPALPHLRVCVDTCTESAQLRASIGCTGARLVCAFEHSSSLHSSVQVCGTTPCRLNGAQNILHTLEEHLGIHLGQTTPDGMFTLGEMECMGCCINAPMMVVADYSKGVDGYSYNYYEDLSPDDAKRVADSYKAGASLRRQRNQCAFECAWQACERVHACIGMIIKICMMQMVRHSAAALKTLPCRSVRLVQCARDIWLATDACCSRCEPHVPQCRESARQDRQPASQDVRA